jgi:hypothetical protein
MRYASTMRRLLLVALVGCSEPALDVVRALEVPAMPAVSGTAVPSTTEPPSGEPPSSDGCPAGWTCDYGAFDGATISSVLVRKAAHELHLLSGDRIVKSYTVALGSGGLGQKHYEGDKVTPIGRYRVTGRYPSKWHTFLALDYPSEEDRARHAAMVAAGAVPDGRGPGSGIAIHGRRKDMPDGVHKLADWTLGCVALDNDEIDEVAGRVPIGTTVVIEP